MEAAARGIEKKWKLMFFAIMLLPVIAVNIEMRNDGWYILASGRYVMQNGIPFTMPFTLHEIFDFVMQQWLTNVIFWNIYRFIGEAGLYIVIIAAFILMIAVTYKASMLISEGNFFSSFTVTLILSVFSSTYICTRPQVFSNLIFVTEMYLLELYFRKKRVAYLVALPVLSALLVNIHASMWLMFFVLALPFVAESFKIDYKFIKADGCRKAPLFAFLALSAAAGFANPYGLDAMTYLFRSYGNEYINQLVGEMHPLNISEAAVFYLLFFAMAAVLIVKKTKFCKIRYLLLGLGTFLLSLMSYRSMFIFLICAAYPFAYFLKDAFLNLKIDSPESSVPAMRNVLAGILVIFIATGFAYKGYKIATQKTVVCSAGAVEYLLDNNEAQDIRLYTGYSDGPYPLFMGIKVYLDARAEAFLVKNNHREDVLSEYFLMQSGQLYYRDVIDKYDFTHLYAVKGDILYTYLENDNDFKLVYEDEYGRVFMPV